jgi:hypothetical protein
MKRIQFDRQAAIAAAWDLLWASNLEQRKREDSYRPSTTYYLTASDLEAQVRAFADETAEGKEWGSTGRAYGRGYGSRIRFSGDLLGDCRDWLRNNRRLTSHNFGRGHISGARYRPVGEPLAPAEEGTLQEKAKRASKPRPIHMRAQGKPFLCAPVRKGPRWSSSRSQAHVSSGTGTSSAITCPRCLKIMNQGEVA